MAIIRVVTRGCYTIGVEPTSLDTSACVNVEEASLTPAGECVGTNTVPAYCVCVCVDTAGKDSAGVGKSSGSPFSGVSERRANTANVINQNKSSPSSVQAKIVCVNENVEVDTSMDTSSS